MNRIKTPFTKQQVKALNKYQKRGAFHPFTCCSHFGCKRMKKRKQGMLLATAKGWICPCGNYKQSWAHVFMLGKQKQKQLRILTRKF